ncbi:MAG: hypothetical protein U9Q63_04120, partial [Patescibacteria group bacterium]|nr:hypothetical protein [Patescibacteria group bacterium]
GGKKVRGLNSEFMSSNNCDGVDIPIYVREGDGKRLELGQGVAWLKADYKGRQLPGGSNGIAGALRVVTGINEDEAWKVIIKAYEVNEARLGNHNDDNHGALVDFEEIKSQEEGCGNQDKIVDNELLMYKDLGVDSGVRAERIEIIKRHGGSFPALTGKHEEKAVAVNLVMGKTFDTTKAVGEEESVFNADLWAAMEVGEWLYKELSDEQRGDLSKEEFVKDITKAVLRDYLQTAKALGAEKTLSVNASEGVNLQGESL